MKVHDSQKTIAATLNSKQADTRQGKDAGKVPVAEEGKVSSAPARVDISDQSKEAQKAAEILRNTPEVRWEKVEALKAKIEAGEYKVDGQKVADKMLRQIISELIR